MKYVQPDSVMSMIPAILTPSSVAEALPSVCKIVCVVFVPNGGVKQCMWANEWAFAGTKASVWSYIPISVK